jgi:hypothetical protein
MSFQYLFSNQRDTKLLGGTMNVEKKMVYLDTLSILPNGEILKENDMILAVK